MTPDELGQAFNGILMRVGASTPAYTAIADLMVSSAQHNFETEGRPSKWVPLQDATRKYKEKHGWTKILFRSGMLRDRIVPSASEAGAVIGNNLPYAQTQNDGKTITMPAREGTARFRQTAGGSLMSQASLGKTFRNAGKMVVFAKASHKRAFEMAFKVGAYSVTIPARPFMLFQPGEKDIYTDILVRYWLKGELTK